MSTTARWTLEEAKARLRDLVARAASGPQRIVIGGRDAAIVLSVPEFERLRGERPETETAGAATGAAIAEAFLREMPLRFRNP